MIALETAVEWKIAICFVRVAGYGFDSCSTRSIQIQYGGFPKQPLIKNRNRFRPNEEINDRSRQARNKAPYEEKQL